MLQKDQRISAEDLELALQIANPNLIPSTTYKSQVPQRVITEPKARSKT